jgi:hypothetical protein
MERYVAWRTALLTVILVVLPAFVLPLVAAAQRPMKVPRIGYLAASSETGVVHPSSGIATTTVCTSYLSCTLCSIATIRSCTVSCSSDGMGRYAHR